VQRASRITWDMGDHAWNADRVKLKVPLGTEDFAGSILSAEWRQNNVTSSPRK
jgi:hypothetical protein